MGAGFGAGLGALLGLPLGAATGAIIGRRTTFDFDLPAFPIPHQAAEGAPCLSAEVGATGRDPSGAVLVCDYLAGDLKWTRQR